MINQEDVGSTPTMPAKIRCHYCDRLFSKMGIKSHIWRVHGEGMNFVPRPGPSPLKGLTKDTSEQIKKASETQRRRRAAGEISNWNVGKTALTDQRVARTNAIISSSVNRKIVAGTWHNSFARARRQTYKNESFDGTWEVKLATWFDANSITWQRNKESFPYSFEGKQRRYTPDFFLPNIDCYVEVKGWKTSKDEAKWYHFPKKLVVLSGSDLQLLGLDIEVRKDWKVIPD